MPDAKPELSQQFLCSLVALAFSICAFITAFAEHFFMQCGLHGLQELSLLKVQKSLAGWHSALLLHAPVVHVSLGSGSRTPSFSAGFVKWTACGEAPW